MHEAEFRQKVIHLENEINSLKNIIRNLSATAHSQKQAIGEYLDNNIQLRSSMLLLEGDVSQLRNENIQFIDRVKFLENENGSLNDKVKSLIAPVTEEIDAA